MNIKRVISTLVLVGISICQSAFCEDSANEVKFKPELSLRVRHEFQDWAATPTQDSQSNFGHTKLQVGLSAESDIWKAYLQGQYFQLYGLDSNIGGGPAAAYFSANNADPAPGGLNLRQANITLRDASTENVKVTAGRFLYSGGSENVSSDPQVAWIKNFHVGQRLIGPFDFTGGRSFDGARIDIKNKESLGTITLHGSHPTQGGFETNSFESIEDISLLTASWSLPILSENQDAQLFFYNYDDERDVVKTDNRPIDIRSLDKEQLDINTFGAHYINVIGVSEDVAVDTLVWGAYQFGDWGGLDQKAYSLDAEVGVKFKKTLYQPWIRAGHIYASGDDDISDSTHGTFFTMLPTARIYAMTPLYSQENLQESFLELLLKPSEELSLRSSLRFLRLAEGADLQYFGSGATEKKSRFGYGGNNLAGATDIGELLDLEATYAFNKWLSVTGYVGKLFGGRGYSKLVSPVGDKSITYTFLEFNVKI